VIGVCGKKPEVATLQDLLLHALKGLSLVAREGRRVGVKFKEVDRFTAEAIFSTLTNVNFDAQRFAGYIERPCALTAAHKEKVKAAGGNIDFAHPSASYAPAAELQKLVS
jgi:hydroxylamine reductase